MKSRRRCRGLRSRGLESWGFRYWVLVPTIAALLFAPPLLAQEPAAVSSAEEALELGGLGSRIEALSGLGGYFDTDNLISNERAYGRVVDRVAPRGGVYIGVGPDQNFHYIARLEPKWAFIVDVRRDNVLQHLLMNAALVHSETRLEYLCFLFSRPCVPGRDAGSDLRSLVDTFSGLGPATEAGAAEVLSRALRHIGQTVGFELIERDREMIASIHEAFRRDQLNLRFQSHGRSPRRDYPSYGDLLLETTPTGDPAHFLGSKKTFRVVRDLARAGRLVPVVGDFGAHEASAFSRIAEFAKERGEHVTFLYTSNVEYYLLRDGSFNEWVENVRTLPRRQDAVMLRAYFDYGRTHPDRPADGSYTRNTMVLQPVSAFLELADRGEFRTFWDLSTKGRLLPEDQR